eukprot:gene11328-12340_t
MVTTGTFPENGVHLMYLHDFINDLRDEDYEKFVNKPTSFIVSEFIKPKTSAMKCSYVDYLLASEKTKKHVGKATIFISHTWQYDFRKLVSCISSNAGKGNIANTYIWLDIFSINQHGNALENFDFQWWTGTFQAAIREIHHTLIVFSPWHQPAVLQRAWCLWEIYSTIITDSRMEIAIHGNEESQFIDDVLKAGGDSLKMLLTTLNNIDSEKSRCYDPLDEQRIHKAIQDSLGFEKINKLVSNVLKERVQQIMEEKVRYNSLSSPQQIQVKDILNTFSSPTPDLVSNVLLLPNSLTSLHESADTLLRQGKFDAAEAALLKALERDEREFGLDHPVTLSTMQQLGLVYLELKDYDKSKDYLLKCYEYCDNQPFLFYTEEEKIPWIYSYAQWFRLQGDTRSAEIIYQKHFANCEHRLLSNHPIYLEALRHLQEIKQEKHQEVSRVNRGISNHLTGIGIIVAIVALLFFRTFYR